jgi:hypothetical protein
METVRYLLRVRGTECSPFGIEPAPVARNRSDAATLLKLLGETLGRAIGQQIRDTVQIQIDKDRAILLSFPPSPIVDSRWGISVGTLQSASFLSRRSTVSSLVVESGKKSLSRQSAYNVAN